MTQSNGKSPARNWTIEKAFKQLDFCEYQTKDGHNELKMNDAYQWLKEQLLKSPIKKGASS